MPYRFRSTAGLALMVGAALLAAAPGHAQGMGAGFVFKQPVVTLTARGGFAHASAGSDLFSFVTDTLTLQRSDFSGPSFGADLSIRAGQRFDVVLGAEYVRRSARSEFRNWVEEVNGVDVPIEQTTEFHRLPLTASAKLYLLPRGRSIGRFAWVPNRVVPYVGAGGGAMWYRFRQEGDFVDFMDGSIFTDDIQSSGWTGTLQGLAGAEVSLSPRIALTGETRYVWARDELSEDFQDFDPIDLSGFSATLGLSIRL